MLKENKKIKLLKQGLLVIFTYLIIVFLLFYKSKNVSGGDIFIAFVSVISLILMTIFIGIITIKKRFKEKLGFIFGLVICYIIESIIINFFL
jgi:hypothetical protein